MVSLNGEEEEDESKFVDGNDEKLPLTPGLVVLLVLLLYSVKVVIGLLNGFSMAPHFTFRNGNGIQERPVFPKTPFCVHQLIIMLRCTLLRCPQFISLLTVVCIFCGLYLQTEASPL